MGYIGYSMSNRAAEAYNEGKKPFSKITKDDILKHGVNESISFFRWYVKKYCRPCEWHHTSKEFNMTDFYDIENCCNIYKKADIEKLKNEYKNIQKSKAESVKKDNDYYENPCYAKIEYSIKPFKGSRKYFEVYCILHKCWAYIKDDYRKSVIKKKINGNHLYVLEKYENRPEEMPESVANEILQKLS